MVIIYPTRLKGVELKSYNLEKRQIGMKASEDTIARSIEWRYEYTEPSCSRSKVLKEFEDAKERNRIYDWVLYINDEIVLSYPDEQSATLVIEDIIAALTEDASVFILKEEEKKNDI